MIKLKILDKVIIIAILIINILPAGVLILAKPSNENSSIVIRVNNSVEKVIPLDGNKESKIYEFSFNNNVGYVEVKDGKVRMLEMNKKICPEAICSKTGWIDKSYQSIVCLPNDIVVTIEGSRNEELDIQAY